MANSNYLGPQSRHNVTRPQQQQQNAAYNNGTPRLGCVTKAFKVTGIMHVVAGALCIVLGIAAIILQAFQSYVATPIWAGLFFFIVTGILGIVYNHKPKNMCIVISYMVMTILSAALAGIMWIIYIVFDAEHYYYYGECVPLHWSPCYTPGWARLLVNCLITVVAFLEMGCAIAAAAVTCFKACRCCRQCCTPCCTDGPPSDTMVYYSANGRAGAPMMTVPVDQHNRPIYIAGQTAGAFPSGSIMIMAPGPMAQPAQVQSQGQPTPQAQMGPNPQAQGQTMPQAQCQGQAHGQGQFQGNVAPAQIQMIPAAVFYPPHVVGQPLPQGRQQQQHQQQQKGAETAEHPSDPTEDETTEVALEPTLDEASGHTTSGQFSDQSALI